MDEINEELIFPTPGVLEKLSGDVKYNRPLLRALYVSEDDQEYIRFIGADTGAEFIVERDAVTINKDGTIRFSAFDSTYLIRRFEDNDGEWFSGYGIPLTPEIMEGIMERDGTESIEEAVEAFTDTDTGELSTIVYTVTGLGSFYRLKGKWVILDEEARKSFEGSTISDIDYTMAFDLVERFDSGERIMDVEDYAISVDEDDDLMSEEAITAAVGACPPATQDVALNLEKRSKAIETANYGPLNPAEPNEEYWAARADTWSVTPEEAKKSRCGNCAIFIQTPRMLECIATGLGNEEGNDAWGSIEAGDLGYCEAFDFKCASSRTCDAWVAGGPVTEEKSE